MARRSAGTKRNRAKSRKKIAKGTKLPSLKTLGAMHNTIGGRF